MNCPQCGNKLKPVRQSPNSPLNSYQFDAVKAGDWCCDRCIANEATGTNYKYFWERDLRPIEEAKIDSVWAY